MNRNLLHIIVGGVLLPGVLWAQTDVSPTLVTLPLQECIRRAINIAPGVASAMSDREVIAGKLSQAKGAYFLPEVKLRVLGGPVPDVPDGSGPEANFPVVNTRLSDLGLFVQARVEAIQPLFTFGKLSNLKLAAEKGVEAKEAQIQVAKNEVTRNVRRAYYGVVALRSVQEFITEIRDRANDAKKKVEEMLKKRSGEVTQIDLMRLDVFFAEAEKESIEVNNGIELGMRTLGILVGGLQGSPVSPEDQTLRAREISLKPVGDYLSLARTTRPELKQLEDLVVIKRSLMKSVKADFFPLFFVGGFYGYGTAPGRESVDNPFLRDDFNFNTGGVSLGLEQKLSFHMTNGKFEEASADYHKALADRDMATMGIELEIRKAYSDVVTKRDAMRAAREGFKAGRSWVTASTLNFNVGLVPVKDLLEAFVAYSKVKLGYFDVIHDFDFALTELSKAVGEDIVENKS